MRTKELFCLALTGFLALILWGCGSNLDSGGSNSGEGNTLADAQALGVDNCLTCHQNGVAQVWLGGVHGNPDQLPIPGLNDPDCVGCHDSLGDGQKLFVATNGDEANRPVVSCEACHGGGQFHRGTGPLPFPKAGFERCGQCHNDSFPHGSQTEGKGIVEAFRDSPHTRSINDAVLTNSRGSEVRARCAKCHTDAGARLYRDNDGDYAVLTAALPNTLPGLNNPENLDCRTCHNAHDEAQLLETSSVGRSAEFNTCTNCHQLLQANNNSRIIAYHDPAANPYGAAEEVITDTHFATPGNFVNGTNAADITGYVFDFASDRACRDCHNPHNVDTSINEQWAASKHADLTAAGAWAHYNWTEIPGAVRNDFTVVGAFGDRRPCQRCHTTTGVIAYLTANADADPAEYVAPLAYSSNFKPEMLKCNGCHTDNLGQLRVTGQITAPYTNAPHQYPDAGDSNLCLACHTGVESGESIKNNVDADGILSFVNSHYLTAGGTIYTASGYEYAGQSYANPDLYAHDTIGGDGDGPCVGCHLSAVESHSFEPIARDVTGVITAITSPLCATCHAGENALTPDKLTTEEEDFAAALEALDAQLGAQGIFFSSTYPYYYNGENASGGPFTGWNTAAEALGVGLSTDPTGKGWKDVMGAAFNYNLLKHDPGAYVHNRFYTKRLLFDAIDFLDNGLIDASVEAAIDALVTADSLDAAEAGIAKTYLDGDAVVAGVQRP